MAGQCCGTGVSADKISGNSHGCTQKAKRTRGAHETHRAGENYRKQMEKLKER